MPYAIISDNLRLPFEGTVPSASAALSIINTDHGQVSVPVGVGDGTPGPMLGIGGDSRMSIPRSQRSAPVVSGSMWTARRTYLSPAQISYRDFARVFDLHQGRVLLSSC